MTRPGGRVLAALLLAAVLGVSGGVVTALQGPVEPGQQQAEDPGASEPTSTPGPTSKKPKNPPDPLDLGVPRKNLACDDKTYILVGWGSDENALYPALADWADMKYARTDKSCDTAFPTTQGKPATWVAYLPGFESMADACAQRMTSAHKGDYITRMQSGNDSAVLCPCVMDIESLPELGEGMDQSTETGMWVYQYTTLLSEAYPEDLDDRTTYFSRETVEATGHLQTDYGLNPTIVTDHETWATLRDRTCRFFNF